VLLRLLTLDAPTATQVISSASSIAERIEGLFLVAEKIYSVYTVEAEPKRNWNT
jgi:hypothetical protein